MRKWLFPLWYNLSVYHRLEPSPPTFGTSRQRVIFLTNKKQLVQVNRSVKFIRCASFIVLVEKGREKGETYTTNTLLTQGHLVNIWVVLVKIKETISKAAGSHIHCWHHKTQARTQTHVENKCRNCELMIRKFFCALNLSCVKHTWALA